MPCPILGWELSKDYALTELTNSRWGSDKKEANKHLTQIEKVLEEKQDLCPGSGSGRSGRPV